MTYAITQADIDARKYMLKGLLPRGKAWETETGTEFDDLLDACAREYARLGGRAIDLLNTEINPATSVELLEDWERVLGLPDASAPAGYTANRNEACAAKLAFQGGQAKSYYEGICDKLGYTQRIFRHYFAERVTGDISGYIRDWHWRHTWMLLTPSQGASADAVLNWLIQQNRQIHTLPLMSHLSFTTRDTSTAWMAMARSRTAVVVVGSGGAIKRSVDNGTTWGAVTSGTAEDLYSVVWQDGVFVVVGNSNGIILTSVDDGVSWVDRSFDAGQVYYGVATNGTDLLVLVGEESGGMVTYTSIDSGANWVFQNPSHAGILLGVCCYAGHWTAVGTGGTLFTSDDPTAGWTEQASGTTEILYHVTDDGTTCVAVGASSTALKSVNAGVTWTAITGVNGTFYTVRKCCGLWLLPIGAGYGDMYVSEDLATWLNFGTSVTDVFTDIQELSGGRIALASLAGIVATEDLY